MKRTFHILATLAFFCSLLTGLSGCGQESSTGADSSTASQAPLGPADLKINDYEKATNDFVKTARKFKGGDVSLTLRYIDLSKEVRAWPAKLQAGPEKLTPQQNQRIADISAKAAPYLPQ